MLETWRLLVILKIFNKPRKNGWQCLYCESSFDDCYPWYMSLIGKDLLITAIRTSCHFSLGFFKTKELLVSVSFHQITANHQYNICKVFWKLAERKVAVEESATNNALKLQERKKHCGGGGEVLLEVHEVVSHLGSFKGKDGPSRLMPGIR